jgi:hypothetical protein
MCLFLFFYTMYPLRTHTKNIMCLYFLWYIICYMLCLYAPAPLPSPHSLPYTTSANLDPTSREFSVYFMHILWNLVLFWFNSIIYYFRKRTTFLALSLFVAIIFILFYTYFDIVVIYILNI